MRIRGAIAALGLGASLAFAGAPPDNRLEGASIVETGGVRGAAVATDGVFVVEGDFWWTDRTAVLASPEASLTLDLGTPERIGCLVIQADNDDVYRLESSIDGERFLPLWTTHAVPGAGMRTRRVEVDRELRFLRLRAAQGDGRYAVAELAAYASCPAEPSSLAGPRVAGVPLVEIARTRIWIFGFATALFLLGTGRGAPRRRLLLAIVPIVALAAASVALAEIRPFFALEPDLRAVVALLALLLVSLEAFAPERFAPRPRIALSTLAVLAAISAGCWLHFGSPQFRHAAEERPTRVHMTDMRHYFPSAKYFSELGYDGLYLASLAAYADLAAAGDPRVVDRVRVRDLDSYAMTRGAAVREKIGAVRARFSEERWSAFLADMKWFLDSMGRRDYLGSITDHGGNATPVWLIGGWLLFRDAVASESLLTATALLDPLLLAAAFLAIGRAFGTRVALYALVLFGATDFYQFGSNLLGSTLRQDWLAALGLGIAALASGRAALGGALLAYGGLIRAFPALAAIFLLAPIAWALVERRARLGTVAAVEPSAVRAVVGAAIAIVLLLGASTVLFGAGEGWGTWLGKIRMHAVEPSVNNVGLRNVLAFSPEHVAERSLRPGRPEPWTEWQRRQRETLARRRPLFLALVVLAAALAILAARGRPPHHAAVIGLLLVPIIFYPSNYYCHFVFLLPLAAAPAGPRDRTFAWIVAVVAALCVAQWTTVDERWSDVRYTKQSLALLAAIAAILVPLAAANLWRRTSPSSHPGAGIG